MNVGRRGFVAGSIAAGAGALAAGSQAASRAGEPAKAGVSTPSDLMEHRTYLMPAPLEATWKAYTDPAARRIWWGFPTDELKTAAEVRPLELIKTVVNHPGLPGVIEMTVRFKAVAGGTQISHSHAGFGDSPVWQNAWQTTVHGLHEMMSDLALYLRTGAGFPRHVRFSCFDLMKGTREVAGGLEVFDPQPGTLAEEIGLRPGDTIVSLAGAGVFGFCDVHFATRSHAAGDLVEVKWVRDGKLMSAKGHMTSTVARRETAAPAK
jgi:hypothetical protein